MLERRTPRRSLLNRSQSRREFLWFTMSAAGLASLGAVLTACRVDDGDGDGGGAPDLIGTDMEKAPTQDFTLTDHRNQTVSLSDFEGKAVALTFVFTNCTDVCPLIASRLAAAYEELPDDTKDDVALVAVTVDPARDTVEAMQQFTAEHGLDGNPNWYALTGDREQLEPIWNNYFIDPGRKIPRSTPESDHGDDHGHGERNSDYSLPHTDAIYIIDPESRLRVLMRSQADPSDIAQNLEVLAQ